MHKGGMAVDHVSQRAQKHSTIDCQFPNSWSQLREIAGRAHQIQSRGSFRKHAVPRSPSSRERISAQFLQCCSMRCASSLQWPSCRIRQLVAATAQASGCAVKECPWKNVRVGRRVEGVDTIWGEPSVAASGSMPPVNVLPAQIRSGAMPACWCAQSVPVRPPPVITSSAMKSTPCRAPPRQMARSSSGECIRMPPAPCTSGSMMTAATSPRVLCQHVVKSFGRNGNLQGAEQQRLEAAEEERIAADGHGAEGVAVVAVLEADEAASAPARRDGTRTGTPSSARLRPPCCRCRSRRRRPPARGDDCNSSSASSTAGSCVTPAKRT